MKTNRKDMPPAEIKYRLAQKALTYSDLDHKFGLPDCTCTNAAKRPDPKGEIAISAVLELKPAEIWPSRYDKHGRRLRPQPPANYTPKPAHGKRQSGAAA